MIMVFRLNLMFVFLLGWSGVALGQKTITPNPVVLVGTVVRQGDGPQSLVLKAERAGLPDAKGVVPEAADKREWTVFWKEDTKVKVMGPAETDALTPGTCVRFTAQIDKRTSKAVEKVAKLTIFTQSPGVAERTIGVDRASEHPAGKPGEANPAGHPPGQPNPQGPVAGATPAAKPGPAAVAGADLSEDTSSETPAPRPRAHGAKAPDKSVPDVAAYDVCGKITSFRKGVLVVAAKNRFFRTTVTVELSDDAKIDLDLGDHSVTKSGDRIGVMGFYVTPGTLVITRDIQARLANPFVPASTRSRRTRPGAHGSDAVRRPGGNSKQPAEVKPPAKELPPAKAEPEAKPEPAPAPNIAPPAEETKPEPKKAEKKPPVNDDQKNVFDD